MCFLRSALDRQAGNEEMQRGVRPRAGAPRRWLASGIAAGIALAPWMISCAVTVAVGLIWRGKRQAAVGVLAISGLTHGARHRRDRVHRHSYKATPTFKDHRDAIRLVSVNVWSESKNLESIAEELTRVNADIMVLQELTPVHLRQLDELGALSGYRAHAVCADAGHTGMGVWSRFELGEPEWFHLAGERQVKVRVLLPSGQILRLYGVHAPSPVPSKVDRWFSWFRAMAEECSREIAVAPHPMIVAGDFNATMDHGPFRRLLGPGLVDAALLARKCRGTWPNRFRPLPPLFRIDHVLLSPALRVSACGIGRGRGSDHRPVIVDLRL